MKVMLCTVLSTSKRSRKERAFVRELQEIVNELQFSFERRIVVEAFRKELSGLEPGTRWRLIDELPRLCPGLAIVRKRDGSEKRTYTGVALISVGGLHGAAEVESVKRAAASLPMTLLAVTGSSGHSVKILVRGELDNGKLPTAGDDVATFHRRLYNMACRTYSALLPKNVTIGEGRANDIMRWTYDNDLIYNADAAPYLIKAEELKLPENIEERSLPYGKDTVTPESRDLWQRRFSKAVITALDEVSPDEESGERDEEALLSVTAREAYTAGIPVEETVHLAKSHYRWHHMGERRIRVAVECVFDELSQQTKPEPKNDMQNVTYRLQEWVKSRYDLRYNELANGVEWRYNTSYSHKFHPIDTRTVNSMIQEANERGLEIFDRDMKRYLGSAHIRSYNEAQAYIYGISRKWDGKTDYIGALARRVPTKDKAWPERFHTWFLGMVAQWLGWDRRHGNSVVPLLVGPQGCGKSTFGQLLLPQELRDVGYRELVDFSSKQEAERILTNSLLVNLDEFNQISEKMQQGFLKNLIQKSSVKGRRPYSSTIVNLPRYASFIATTNYGGALSDPTGSRRFIVVDITDGKQIDTQTPVPYEDIYSQARAELEAGRRYWFTPDEVAQLEEHNTSSSAERPEIRHFLDVFSLCTEETADTQRMKVSQLLMEIRRQTGYRPQNNATIFLGRWLSNEARAGRVLQLRSHGTTLYVVRNS